jgi:Bacterial type II/III secretion system short domain
VRKRILFAAFAAISLGTLPLPAAEAPSGNAADATVRVFVLKYKRVEEAALLIRPHLSDSASVTLTQRLNAMTVTDREENLKTIARVIAEFDAPPRGFTFAVKLVRARADVPSGSIASEIGGLGAKLKTLFQFNDYALIDSAVLRGVEGGSLRYQLGPDYLLSFAIHPGAPESHELLLSGLSLSRVYSNPGEATFLKPLYRTSVPITLNQTLVLGASRDEASKSALILIVLAEEAPRADAEKGAPGAKAAEKKK